MPEIKPDGRIVTFYSYKGGTGRSMALANFAWIVAASGKRVLTIDWDLEAPGLHRYFRPFLTDADLAETDGLINTFWSFAASAVANPSTERQPAEAERAEAAEALEDATRRLDWKFPSRGYIDLIGAGRQDGTYSQRVNSFDWKRFFEVGGLRMLTAAKEHLRRKYDWILIDSRTGVSDTSGVCTILMPEAVVACFTLNRQSIEGITGILRSIRAYRSPTVDGSAMVFYPIATRIENAEQAKLEIARGYARSALGEFLPKAMQSRPRDYWDKMEFSYRPAYAFEETLAAFGDATGSTGAADTMLAQVEATAQQITGDPHLRMPEILDEDRTRILAKYSLGSLPAAPSGPPSKPEESDTEFLRNIRAKEQLWRTQLFPWRLLLSQRELDLLTDDDRKAFGRNMAFYLVQSERMQKVLRRAGAWAALMILLSVVAALTFSYLVLGMSFEAMIAAPLKPFASLEVACVVFLFTGASLITRERPYGVRLLEIAMILVRGPLRHDIQDYDPPSPGPSKP